jgi:hypothetical protein
MWVIFVWDLAASAAAEQLLCLYRHQLGFLFQVFWGLGQTPGGGDGNHETNKAFIQAESGGWHRSSDINHLAFMGNFTFSTGGSINI